MGQESKDLTILLKGLAEGDERAAAQLLPIVYSELRRLAGAYMRRERSNHTLQPTALVNEAYMKLMQQKVDWQSRAQFFGFAANLMRQVLIDHARSHNRQKRGAGQEIKPLEGDFALSPQKSDDLLRLDEALNRLSKLDARQSRIVELRFFGGLTVEETAHVLGVSPKTVKRSWSMAKAWLYGDLRQNHGHSSK